MEQLKTISRRVLAGLVAARENLESAGADARPPPAEANRAVKPRASDGQARVPSGTAPKGADKRG